MMNALKKINPEWSLRLGLGMMYLYSGYDLFAKPQHWYGFVPSWFSQAVTHIAAIDTYLRVQGMGEMAIGFVFLAWFLPRSCIRVGSLLTILEMALIILFVGIDPITFRDIGLLGAGFAVAGMAWTERKEIALMPESSNEHG